MGGTATTGGQGQAGGTWASPARWTGWHTAGLLLGAAAIGAVGVVATPRSRVVAWALVSALMLAMTAIAGKGATGRVVGALIDRRNKVSLSRLQMLLWTILVAGGFFVAGMANALAGVADPIGIDVPSALWALVGIATSSAVAVPVIHGVKAGAPADSDELAGTLRALADRGRVAGGGPMPTHVGRLMVNPEPAGARFSDLLTGEEVGDAAELSLGKLQLGFVTLVVLILYGAALAETLAAPVPIRSLPGLDDGLVTLIGISHVGYLGQKATPQSRTPP